MKMLSIEEREMIRDAVTAAEAVTSGQIVAVLALASDTYRFIPTMLAALVALFSPGLVLAYGVTWSAADLYLLQGTVFLLAMLILHVPAIRLRIVPRTVKDRRTARMAYLQFFKLGLHTAPERATVMIYVSLAERSIHLLADHGINRYATPQTWDEVTAAMTKCIRQDGIVQSYLEGIQRVAVIMKQHFPGHAEDANRFRNDLVIIE